MRRLLFVSLTSALLACVSCAQQQESTQTVNCAPDHRDQTPDEAQCLKQLSGLATRSGDLLHLTLDNGKTKTFKSEREACERHQVEKCVLYRLAAYHASQRLFVVDLAAYESFSVVAVHRPSGSETRLDDHPHIAPGGKRFVTAFSSEVWDVERDIAIYSIAQDSPKLEWEYKAQDYEMWEFVAWDGDDRVQLSVTSWRGKDSSSKPELATRRAEPRRTAAGWQLNKNLGELP